MTGGTLIAEKEHRIERSDILIQHKTWKRYLSTIPRLSTENIRTNPLCRSQKCRFSSWERHRKQGKERERRHEGERSRLSRAPSLSGPQSTISIIDAHLRSEGTAQTLLAIPVPRLMWQPRLDSLDVWKFYGSYRKSAERRHILHLTASPKSLPWDQMIKQNR